VIPVLTAVTDARWESVLVEAFGQGAYGVAVVRRCVDLADLLATAATGTARAALLSGDLRRLDREALARLAAHGVASVGLAADEPAERRLRQLGVRHVVPADAAPATIAAAVTDAVAGAAEPQPEPAQQPDVERGPGRVVAVWGPTGAPGRTTYAVTLAAELAAAGTSTTLVDADVYGGAVAPALGLLDESPGLAAAVRLANNGLLDVPALARVARAMSDTLRVLSGISRPDRWPEIRPSGVEAVLALCRRLTTMTVVDCGFGVEAGESRRDRATLAVLADADAVVAVGSADPVSLQRLVRGLGDLRDAVPGVLPDVVVNRVRDGVMPGNPQREITAALERYAGVTPTAFLPYDRAATDAAAMHGRSLTEVARKSRLRQAIRREALRLDVPAELAAAH
jgi:MinD-like ATPase involved in chromosome partitioning or flagellar assembly